MNVAQQTACLSFNLIMVDCHAFLFNCATLGRVSDSMTVPTLTFHSRDNGCDQIHCF